MHKHPILLKRPTMTNRTTTSWTTLTRVALSLALVLCASPAVGGIVFNHVGLAGGSRWDAAPRMISGRERSLDGGLRYSLDGGSFLAYRDSFSWNVVPSVVDFQQAVDDAFAAWTVVDPASGLGTSLGFVADLSTPVADSGFFGGVNTAGAEIDLLATDAGDTQTRAVTFFNDVSSNVTLTSGTPNYPLSRAISGADINMNNNPGAVYSLNFFRRLLTHEIGHAVGLGDVDVLGENGRFIDDNYNPADALATATNSWAAMVEPLNPAASSGLGLFTFGSGNPGAGTPGVNILMESFGLGIATGNPTSNLTPLTNDDYGTRQFLYPQFLPEPSTITLLLIGSFGFATRGRGARRRRS